MDRFDPFVKYADVYGDIINWEKDPMNKPQNQNKYFFSDGKTYYEQICKMLRLMSVFKEAFNQIYSNEDEISEAWENFVNNLSASVVEGSEPDVTLTWTDDSVNFEFTMVPGVQGDPGVGITSISFNSDYTMTITLSDGNTYTSMSLKGETGPQGPQGETGSGLQILDVYATLADLQSAHPTGQPGDAYQVGSAGNYTLYIWSSSQSAWIPAGSLGTVSPSLSNPLMDGTASAGSLNQYSRGDHVHPTDTSRASQEELDALIRTSQALIDQSFTYRESPAIQDGLARIDKIKGNTLVWNQIFPTQTVNYTGTGYSLTSANDGKFVLTVTETVSQSSSVNHSSLVLPVVNRGHKLLLLGSTDKIDINYKAYGVWGNRIYQSSSTDGYTNIAFTFTNLPVGTYTIYPQIFDLTQMGLDISSPSEFTSLFSLPYYDFNQGELIPFNGTGIKTGGENLIDFSTLQIGKNWFTGSAVDRAIIEFDVEENTEYTISLDYSSNVSTALLIFRDGWNTGQIGSTGMDNAKTCTFTTPLNCKVVCVQFNARVNGFVLSSSDFYGFWNCALTDTFNTTTLPISTYFPTGMKSAGNVYDELTKNKAFHRTRIITLNGTQTIAYDDTQSYRVAFEVPDIKPTTASADTVETELISNYLSPSSNNNTYEGKAGIHRRLGGRTQIMVCLGQESGADTVAKFNEYLASHPLTICYPLNTETEENIDIDLSFSSYQDGTEQLLPVNGSVPATSPIIADMTYLSIDDAMEYIIDKLANVPQNTQQILESLEDDVADLQADVGALQPAVSGLQTSVGNINTNIGQISSTVAGHTSSISDMQSDITDLNTGLNNLNTGLNNLEDTVTDNTSRIGTLETGLTNTDSQVDAIDARVLNLETDLLKIVKKEYDYDSVAGNGNFGVQTGLQQEAGYKIIGIVGSEVQQGENTSGDPWIIVTQAHVHYTSTGGVVLSMKARNVSEYTRTNVRVYLYLLCIKDTQSE